MDGIRPSGRGAAGHGGHTGHDFFAAERRYLRPDGTVVWANLHIYLLRDQDGKPDQYLAHGQDLTKRKRVEAELAHLALHDALTDRPNRALITDRLVQGLVCPRERGSQLGVILLGIDQFKNVNDAASQAVGARCHGRHRTG